MGNDGMRKYEVEQRLREKIAMDPDLKYYIDNEYVMKLVDLLIEGIGEIIEDNNRELFKKL